MSPGMLAPPPPPPAEQRRQSMRPPCSNLFPLLSAPMTKRRGSRGAHKRRGSRGAHRKGRHGGQRHQRSADAQQRRAAKWSSVLRTRLRGRLARLPVRRVLLGNGVRLCPQCPLPDDREGFLERAVRDVAARGRHAAPPHDPRRPQRQTPRAACLLPGLGGKAAGGSRRGLPNGLEPGTQGCCTLYMDPGPVWAGVANCPPLQPVRSDDCRRRLCLPGAVGVPDGLAAGC